MLSELEKEIMTKKLTDYEVLILIDALRNIIKQDHYVVGDSIMVGRFSKIASEALRKLEFL